MPSAPGGRRSGPAAAEGPAAAAAVAAAVDVALAQVAAQPERLRAAGSGVREAPRAVGGRHVGGWVRVVVVPAFASTARRG